MLEFETIKYDSIEHNTDSAILLKIEDKKYWIPISLIEEIDEKNKRITVEKWILIEKGLEDYIV